jgi:carbamoyltransferase
MSVNILGISAYFHDAAAALVVDGEIVAAAQEERFTRVKGDARLPRRAIEFCLTQGGVTADQLDYVAFYEKPLVKLERLLETYLRYAPRGFVSFRRAAVQWARLKLHLPREVERTLGREFRGQLCFAEHHESHGASAFFPSPFEEAAVLTLDAVGEWATSSIGVGRGNRLSISHEMRFPHSLGMLYSAFTYYTGFKVNSGEYKLMGLAPYGEPRYVDLILKEIVDIRDDGSLWLDMSYFDYCYGLTMTSKKFHDLFGGPPRPAESLITQRHMDLAASIQAICEEVVLRACRHAHRLTGLPNLVMAGGVALNCVANGRVLREGPFRNLWVQPAAGDAGGALGAALVVWHHVLDQPRRPVTGDSQQGSLLGPSFTAADVKLYLDSIGAIYEDVMPEDRLVKRVAELLDQEKTIGWFHGRMEYGPRALGARSIIGDARSPRMQQVMNLKIKFRESFRPFAPCVLAEFADDVFDVRPGEESPYMLLVAPVRTSWRTPLSAEDREKMRDSDLRVRVSVPRSRVPAITHVDYSARIQTVDEARHGRFYRLMRAFYELSGCPVIVNTSFNIRGEPIVCDPGDAFRCFMATDLDCLVLEDCVLLKEAQPEALRRSAEAYKSKYALD